MTSPTWGDNSGNGTGRGGLAPAPLNAPPGLSAQIGVQPGATPGIFIGHLVIISSGGPTTGLFVYSGVPALGNPPVASIVAPGVTSDPYGNPTSAILNIGNFSGAHFGVNSSGDIFLVNSSDLVIFHGRTSDGSFFWYDTAGQGVNNLNASISPANTTDPAGNSVNAGFQVHGTGSAANAAGNVEINVQGGPVPIAFFTTGAVEITTSGNVQAEIVNPGVSQQNEMFIVGPQIVTFTQYVFIILASPAKDGSIGAAGSLQYNDGTSNHGLLLWGGAFGGVKSQTLFSGDTTNYDLGENRLVLSSDLLINTTGFTQQVFGTVTLGVGSYVIEGQLHAGLAAAGQPQFTFTGGGGLALTMLIDWYEINDAAPATFGNSGTTNGLAVVFGGATMGAGTRNTRFSGVLKVSTAGTFGMFAATSVAADTFTITALCSYMLVRPVY